MSNKETIPVLESQKEKNAQKKQINNDLKPNLY